MANSMTVGTVSARALIPAIAVLTLVPLAGCGGGDSTGSSVATADFASAANQICKEDNAKFRALGAPTGSDIRPFLAKLVPLLSDDLSRLKSVTPPGDQASTYDAWIADLEQTVERTKKAQGASSSDAAMNLLQGNRPLGKSADAKAKQLGLDQCLTGAGGGGGS